MLEELQISLSSSLMVVVLMGGEVGDQGFEVGHIGSEEKQAVKVLEIYKIIVHTYMQQYSIRMKNLRKKITTKQN